MVAFPALLSLTLSSASLKRLVGGHLPCWLIFLEEGRMWSHEQLCWHIWRSKSLGWRRVMCRVVTHVLMPLQLCLGQSLPPPSPPLHPGGVMCNATGSCESWTPRDGVWAPPHFECSPWGSSSLLLVEHVWCGVLPNKNQGSKSVVFTVAFSASDTSKLDLLLFYVSVLENQIIWCVCSYHSRINLTSSISRYDFIEVNAVVLLYEFLDLAVNLCCLLKSLFLLRSVQSHCESFAEVLENWEGKTPCALQLSPKDCFCHSRLILEVYRLETQCVAVKMC